MRGGRPGTAGDTSLISLLGAALQTRIVPPRRAAIWTTFRNTFENAITEHRCSRPVRSWQALWNLLHRTPAQAQTTWGQLLRDATVENVRKRLVPKAAEFDADIPNYFGVNIPQPVRRRVHRRGGGGGGCCARVAAEPLVVEPR